MPNFQIDRSAPEASICCVSGVLLSRAFTAMIAVRGRPALATAWMCSRSSWFAAVRSRSTSRSFIPYSCQAHQSSLLPASIIHTKRPLQSGTGSLLHVPDPLFSDSQRRSDIRNGEVVKVESHYRPGFRVEIT